MIMNDEIEARLIARIHGLTVADIKQLDDILVEAYWVYDKRLHRNIDRAARYHFDLTIDEMKPISYGAWCLRLFGRKFKYLGTSTGTSE